MYRVVFTAIQYLKMPRAAPFLFSALSIVDTGDECNYLVYSSLEYV